MSVWERMSEGRERVGFAIFRRQVTLSAPPLSPSLACLTPPSHFLLPSLSPRSLSQVIDWLKGTDGKGDCMIILDECHKAKNLVTDSGDSTQTGLAVEALQAAIPNARVLYSRWGGREGG
jgi:hypothetical protein